MKYLQRALSQDADKERMAALARQTDQENLHVVDLPYRLSSWALDDPGNVRIWLDGEGQMAGWAVLQMPFWTIDYACHPAAESQLHPVILAWADGRAQAVLQTPAGHPAWYVMVFEEAASRIRDLEAAGFRCQADVGEDSWSKVLMRRSGQTAVQIYKPPAGYTVRPLAAEEVEAYVELHRSVFDSRNMTCGWRTRTLQHPAYKRDLDIVVTAPDGRLAAFCICWFDEELQEGQVEPLGCHRDFRRYALGRVALSEGLQRLHSLGARNIRVETDSYRTTALRLYESFDFEVARKVLVYRKDYLE